MRYVLRGLYAFHVDSSSMPLRPFIPWASQNQEGTPEKNSKRMDTDWVDCVTKKTWRLPSTLFSLWVLLVRSFRVRLFAWDFEILRLHHFLGFGICHLYATQRNKGSPQKHMFKRQTSAAVLKGNPQPFSVFFARILQTPVSDLGIDFCEPPTRVSVR